MIQVDTRFFRAGVGTVIYNQAGEIALFKRAKYPVGVWQLQQGGIDLGEDIETTLWRELREEVGLTPDDFAAVHQYPHWTVYQDVVSVTDASKSRLGQAHRWYFLALKPGVTIDLSKASEDEASDWRFTTFADAIAETDVNKQHVYQALAKYFALFIKSSAKTVS